MGKGFFHVPTAINEPVKSYAPGTPEREEVLKQYKAFYDSEVDIPLYIGSEEIRTGNTRPMSPPHDHKHILGHYHLAEKTHVEQAIATWEGKVKKLKAKRAKLDKRLRKIVVSATTEPRYRQSGSRAVCAFVTFDNEEGAISR